jgi:hypothetical protein
MQAMFFFLFFSFLYFQGKFSGYGDKCFWEFSFLKCKLGKKNLVSNEKKITKLSKPKKWKKIKNTKLP